MPRRRRSAMAMSANATLSRTRSVRYTPPAATRLRRQHNAVLPSPIPISSTHAAATTPMRAHSRRRSAGSASGSWRAAMTSIAISAGPTSSPIRWLPTHSAPQIQGAQQQRAPATSLRRARQRVHQPAPRARLPSIAAGVDLGLVGTLPRRVGEADQELPRRSRRASPGAARDRSSTSSCRRVRMSCATRNQHPAATALQTRAQQVDAPGVLPERHEAAPDVREQHEERRARRMRNAQRPGGRDEFAGIPEGDRRRERDDVARQHRQHHQSPRRRTAAAWSFRAGPAHRLRDGERVTHRRGACTRKSRAPRSKASAHAAAVARSRSSTGRPVASPRNRLRDTPTSTGRPSATTASS